MNIRPTADRLRETLFDILTAGNPEALAGSVWADLFAGTGAVGIEALSRGAGTVYFIESAAPSVRLIRENLTALEVQNGFEIMPSDALKALRRLEAQKVTLDFVFLDPPYQQEKAYEEILTWLGSTMVLRHSAVVIAEHSRKMKPGQEYGRLESYRKLEQGDAALSFYKRK